MYILNAFSINMLEDFPSSVLFREIPVSEAAEIAAQGLESSVGHADTAAVFSDVLSVKIPANRTNVRLSRGDQVLVGQYIGPRLPEGATELPEDAEIRWLIATVA